MIRLSKEKLNRLILVIIGFLVIAGSIWYLVIKSTSSRLAQSGSALAAAKDKLERYRNWVKQADQMEAAAEEATRQLREFEDGMAPADLVSWSYVLLDKAKAGQAVEITDVTRPQTGQVGVLPDFPYTAATFTVQGNSHYHDLGKFLADFENKFPYFRVQNLSVGAASGGGPETATATVGKEKLYFKMDIVALIKPGQ